MAMWNPWRGCRRCSEGCRFCYIHKGDSRRGIDTFLIVKTGNFDAPVSRLKNGEYKMKSGQLCYLCFSTDFFIEEGDKWRGQCWEMIKERRDITFLFLTKRIERFYDCIPDNWNDGYENVVIGCTVENQEIADKRLDFFDKLPVKHKNIICQPMLSRIDLYKHLNNVELVVAGGESDKNARPLYYNWVLDLREQCVKANVSFEFRQCGTHTVKDNKLYTINTRILCSQAKKAGINFKTVK